MEIDAPGSSEPEKSVLPVVSESEVKSAWLSAFDSALQVFPSLQNRGKSELLFSVADGQNITRSEASGESGVLGDDVFDSSDCVVREFLNCDVSFTMSRMSGSVLLCIHKFWGMDTQANKAGLEKIAPFEIAIKRPYFHVKPLDQAQLTNWWAYLDYKMKSGSSHAAVVRLFERCLVPCAAYSGE